MRWVMMVSPCGDFYDPHLERSQTPIFALTWTAMHPINSQSLLYGLTQDALQTIDYHPLP
jgi:inward rectifier potassium channel